MPDPLSDPRAAQLLATSPDEIDGLAGFFHTVAGQAEQAAGGLRGAHGDESWTGGAADAFRAKLGRLPGDLDTVQASYADVAQALRTYATNVAPIRSQFQSLVQVLHGLQGQLASAQRTLTGAQSNLSNAQGTVSRLADEVSGLDSRGFHLLDEFDTVRTQCRTAIIHAGSRAPQHHSSLFGDICHIADDIGNFVAGAATGVWKHITDLPSAAWAFAQDPFSWRNFTRLTEDVAVTASVVAMVALPFAAPEIAGADVAVDGAVAATDAAEGGAAATAGAEGAAEGAAESSQSLFSQAATRTSGLGVRTTTASGLGSAVGQAGQGHYRQAALDLAFVAAPNIGHVPTSIEDVKTLGDQTANLLGIGERQAEATATAATGARDFQILNDIGLNPNASRSLAFASPEATPAALRAGDPTAEAITSTVASTRAAAQRAAAIATRLGHPVAIALDNLVYDPAKTALAGGSGEK